MRLLQKKEVPYKFHFLDNGEEAHAPPNLFEYMQEESPLQFALSRQCCGETLCLPYCKACGGHIMIYEGKGTKCMGNDSTLACLIMAHSPHVPDLDLLSPPQFHTRRSGRYY